ncbi:hypothetical protein AM500_21375 [Bacillus sp. FJAT-18017]|uniref:hypothetical protein n=1 Tax=Bacillus sp. FJAT-18017 TaxID=1705566 RepID=UPI0006AE7977|nr:hypothetical protein [Bacillus sp. FJAT-18017]ALC92060.1 hypothetical protein AM500_21375 [Bacillus sp. FJAT-18017]
MPDKNDKNDVVIINLDRPREVRFGHKALKKMMAVTGQNLENFEFEGTDLGELEKIMLIGLEYDARRHNEVLKLEDMEDLLDQAPSFSEIMQKMQQAFEAAFGTVEVDEKNDQRIAEKSQ